MYLPCILYSPDQQMHNICCAFVGLDNKNVVQNVAALHHATYHAKYHATYHAILPHIIFFLSLIHDTT